MITIENPKQTVKEYQEYPERFAQLIDGMIVKSPSASYGHQDLTKILFRQIDKLCLDTKIGEVFFADLDVFFDDFNVYQPDLFFIRKDRMFEMKHNGYHGAPEFVIEILSPSNSYYDTKTKKKVYEKYGVKEYWIVDRKTKKYLALDWRMENSKNSFTIQESSNQSCLVQHLNSDLQRVIDLESGVVFSKDCMLSFY